MKKGPFLCNGANVAKRISVHYFPNGKQELGTSCLVVVQSSYADGS